MSESAILVRTTVNGRRVEMEVEPNESLATYLRDRLRLTGLKVSCNLQICGACTVLLNDRAVSACTVLAIEADGAAVRTVEGLSEQEEMNALQRAFVKRGALQCGYCIPGFLMAATELLERIDEPDEAAIRRCLSGNICRCTGYRSIVEAIQEAALERSRKTGR